MPLTSSDRASVRLGLLPDEAAQRKSGEFAGVHARLLVHVAHVDLHGAAVVASRCGWSTSTCGDVEVHVLSLLVEHSSDGSRHGEGEKIKVSRGSGHGTHSTCPR